MKTGGKKAADVEFSLPGFRENIEALPDECGIVSDMSLAMEDGRKGLAESVQSEGSGHV